MRFGRFAAYHLPADGHAEWGAAWLGWNPRNGQSVAHPVIPGLDVAALVTAPRKYGFHATLKAPFRLAEGSNPDDLADCMARIAADHAAFSMPLRLSSAYGFLSLRPPAQPAGLTALESALVRDLDPFRAPLTEAEIRRRRPELLPPQARDHLRNWGYPFVLDMFHYHLTLTGALDAATVARVTRVLEPQLASLLAAPLDISRIALMGEDAAGFFHLIAEFPLTASAAT